MAPRAVPAILLPVLAALAVACGGAGRGTDGTPDSDVATADAPDVADSPDGALDDDTPSPDLPSDPGRDIAAPPSGFPPHVRLLSPSSRSLVGTPDARIVLGGLLTGRADSMSWEGAGTSGSIAPQIWWSSGPIDLLPGDNLLTVTARQGDLVATDAIRIVFTPGLDCPVPAAAPDMAFVGETVTVRVTFPLGLAAPVDTQRLALYRVGADLQPSGIDDFVGRPRDGGQAGERGDEIAGDGVFSVRATVTCLADGPVRFRVEVPVDDGIVKYVALSPPVEVDCVPRVTPGECRAALDALNAARARWDAGRAVDAVAARAAARDLLPTLPGVAESGMGPGQGAWVRMASGLLGVVSLAPDGFRAGPVSHPAARRVALLDPVTVSPSGVDEISVFETALRANDCPRWVRSGPFHGAEVGPERLGRSLDTGVLALAAHGDLCFEGLSRAFRNGIGWTHDSPVEALDLGAALDCDALLTGPVACSDRVACPGGTACVAVGIAGQDLSGVCVDTVQADLRRGRLAVTPGGLAMLPGFLERHLRVPLPDSLVYLGACRSLDAGVLASEFIAAGARTVIGWSGYPTSAGAVAGGSDALARIAAGTSAGVAVAGAPADPGSPDARLVLLGDESLTLSGGDLLDGDFERGALTSWQVEGDGRAIARLGISEPVSGKFMAILSTGLGYTTEAGAIRQPLCLPTGTRTLSFWWQFYSEEFRTYCGSKYQDSFVARLVNDAGVEVPLVRRTIDDLCDASDCSGCCSAEACVGLVASEIVFDQGTAFRLPAWQKVEVDVSAFAGRGPVDLVLEARDRGDSIYDTAVLVDSIEIR